MVSNHDHTVLVEEGKEASGLFVVLDGTVEARRGTGGGPLALSRGDIFGSLEASVATESYATATDALIAEMTAQSFMELADGWPEVAEVLRKLAKTQNMKILRAWA